MLKMTKSSWGLLVLLLILLVFLFANYLRDNESSQITAAPTKMSWNFVNKTPTGVSVNK